MRWLFLFVLALNLAYIAWQISLPSTDSYANVPPLNNVQPIVLLSEVRNQQQSDSVDQVAVMARQETTGDQSSEVTATAGRAVAESAVAAPASLSVSTESASESTPESTPAKESADVTTESAATDKPLQGRNCYTLGPFRDLDVLRSLTREIKPYVVATDFRGSEEKEQSLYWVYIKPEKSFEDAMQTGERLKENKIKDFYVIREGDNINGISLGHFRNKDRALRLAKKVTKLGFDVEADPVYKTYTVYWLDYELADGLAIPEAIFDKYIKSNKTDEVSRLSRDCGT
jgi:hypothetical protein